MVSGFLSIQQSLVPSLEGKPESTLQELEVVSNVEPYLAGTIVQIRLLGDFALMVNGRFITNLDVPRLQTLLGYLALHRGVQQSRSRIAYTLWPDSTDAQARTNLRNLLFKLRLTLPLVESFLLIERQALGFHPDTVWSVDVVGFERALVQAERACRDQDAETELRSIEEAVRLYQGDLLPGCYDEWLCGERVRLQQLYQAALERLLELQEQARNYLAAILTAQRLLHLDPLQEVTYRHLMRLYAARGDCGSIERTYRTCATYLQQELAVPPGLVTRKAYEQFMQATGEMATTGSVR